jgi:hypothetical protein
VVVRDGDGEIAQRHIEARLPLRRVTGHAYRPEDLAFVRKNHANVGTACLQSFE